MKRKQDSIDSLHNTLRTTSSQVGETRRRYDVLQEQLKDQQLNRQKVINLTAACSEEERRLVQLEQRHGRLDVASNNAWERDLETALNLAPTSPNAVSLPSAAVLRARIEALRGQSKQTRQAVETLQARSKERELKYRRLVSLCTRRPETEVDALVDTLARAVESEKGELEITRVRRFLAGVEPVS